MVEAVGWNGLAGRFNVPSVLPLKYRSFGYGKMPLSGWNCGLNPVTGGVVGGCGAPLPLVGSVGPMFASPLDVESEKHPASNNPVSNRIAARTVLMVCSLNDRGKRARERSF